MTITHCDDTALEQAIRAWSLEHDRLVRELLAWRTVVLATTDEDEAEHADEHFHETLRELKRAVERRDDLIAEYETITPQVPVLIEPDPVGNVWLLAFECPWCEPSRVGPRWHRHSGGLLGAPPILGLRVSRCDSSTAPVAYALVEAESGQADVGPEWGRNALQERAA